MALTSTDWDVNGSSLETYCYSVEELDGKYGVPTLRGGDTVVAQRRGSWWNPKLPETRSITLGMWISSRDAAGMIPAGGRERQLHKNLTELQNLLYKGGTTQVTLTKRWKDPVSGNVVSALAKAELESFVPKIDNAVAARVTASFRLADPYFYRNEEVITLVKDIPQVVAIKGDVPTSKMAIAFNGGLTNGEIVNATVAPQVSLKVASAIASGDKVTLNTDLFTAIRLSDSNNLIGAVVRSGAPEWMRLQPGNNTLTLSASSGDGVVTINYSSAWL